MSIVQYRFLVSIEEIGTSVNLISFSFLLVCFSNILDVIGNLTAMQTLDLSYNEINDLSEPDVFDPPTNLTNLYLSHNRLTQLPLNKILPLPNLKIFDVESNSIGVFSDLFKNIIENGTKLRYRGKREATEVSDILFRENSEHRM